MPSISIVIASYNRATLLEETLKSVFNQKFPDYEVIVIDDGSTDNTYEIVKKYEKKIIYKKINHTGQSAASNEGIRLAKGRYITFLDSDDLWYPDFLLTMYDKIESQDEYDFCFCNFKIFDKDEIIKHSYLKENYQKSGHLFELLLEGQFILNGAFLIKKRCIEKVGGFDEKMKLAKDWDLWLRLTSKFKGFYVDKTLLKIRFHDGNISRDKRISQYNLFTLQKIKEYAPTEFEFYRIKIKKKIKENNRRVGKYQLQKGNLTGFWYLVKSMF